MKNKKVLILGSTGMLGHRVVFRLNDNPDFQVFDLSFRNKLRDQTIICDVTDFTKLEKLIQEIRPEFIINCIGILIKGSNENPKNSILLNAYLPHFLVSVGDKIGAKVIHISTDCVFSGKKGGYVESDFRDADDVYGRGKALGEILSDKHLTLRTSIIGPELKSNGEGLFNWVINQKNEVFGYTQAFWSGVTTFELANIIQFSINNGFTGLINITNGEKISKFKILELLNSELNLKLKVIPFEEKKVDKTLKSTYEGFHYKYKSYDGMIKEMCAEYLSSDIYDF